MTVSFASYEIARTGLFVSERGLSVTGQNISNVNTPGYVRQQAMITSGPYENVFSKNNLYQYGLGADIEQVRQIRHTFMDNIYRQESTTLGYWEARGKTVQDLQSIIAEPMDSGLQASLNNFWDSWQELSKSPESLTVRALVRQRADSVVSQINHLGTQLDKLQDDLNTEIKVRIDDINDITRQIAQLNVKIMGVEVSGDTANDYRDQRNLLVDKLSKMADVNVNEMQDGQLDITLGGYFLVTKGEQTDLYAGATTESGLFNVPMLGGTKIQVPIKSGEMKGLLEARGEVLGVKGSMENGSPYDKIDLVFAVNRDATAAQKADIVSNATKLVNDYKAKGIDVRLGYVEFDGTGYYSYDNATSTYSAGPKFTTLSDFSDIVTNHVAAAGAGTPDGLEALHSIESMSFRDNALKQVILVSNSALDTTTLSVNDVTAEYQNAGITASVIGTTGAVKTQLEPMSVATGSGFYDITSSATATESGLYTQMKDKIYNNVVTSQNIIADVRNRLNLLVNTMAREVNNLHRSGMTLDGNPGQDFFVALNSAYPIEIGNIALNSNLDNLNNLVSSSTGKNGDNTIALDIANMRNTRLIGKTGVEVSLDDFYRSIISYVGNTGSDALNIADSQAKLVASADATRQSIAGVSMDEEMTNMMKYKFAYDAASRVINVIDAMLDTVIQRTGLAGR